MGDVPDGLDRRLEAVVPVEVAVLDHVEDDGGGAHLQVGRDLRHVRVAHDHVQPPVPLGVGVRLVARVDDRPGRRGGAGDLLADVLGALREAVVEPARRLQDLAGAGEDLPGHEERDQRLGEPLERDVPRHEVVLVAPVRVARRIGVVLEEEDVARDPVLAQPLLRLVEQILHDPLAGLVVDDRSMTSSHSGVAYSGWNPVSR